MPDGHGVRHLVFTSDGRYFYAVNELSPQSAVSLTGTAGRFISIRCPCPAPPPAPRRRPSVQTKTENGACAQNRNLPEKQCPPPKTVVYGGVLHDFWFLSCERTLRCRRRPCKNFLCGSLSDCHRLRRKAAGRCQNKLLRHLYVFRLSCASPLRILHAGSAIAEVDRTRLV